LDLKVGLNPYGLTCTIGIVGSGTHRACPAPLGLEGFFRLAKSVGARCLEIHWAHLTALDDGALSDLRDRLDEAGMEPIVSFGPPLDNAQDAVDLAVKLGARTIRTGLSRVLCGDRAQYPEWKSNLDSLRRNLRAYGPYAAQAGVTLAIENHQDFGSEELVELCEFARDGVGITLDTGNALAVGEEPLKFARTVAALVRHVHLKDYRAQFTDEGYRLVRSAIGDGAVPFPEIRQILAAHHESLTSSLEPGALDHRHVRLFRQDWWNGYPNRSAQELAACIAAARRNRLRDDEDFRTPWERNECGDVICEFEMEQVNKSVTNMRTLGWME
jgi:sugar phosphate isomerase/epimerase